MTITLLPTLFLIQTANSGTIRYDTCSYPSSARPASSVTETQLRLLYTSSCRESELAIVELNRAHDYVNLIS